MKNDDLIKLLRVECSYNMPDEQFDSFIDAMSEIHLKNKEVLIPWSKFDSNVYLLKSGIIRYVYFDGDRETTYGFASPGTIMISYHSFAEHKPSFYQLESCGECDVLSLSKARFDELMKSSHKFALWMFHHAAGQLYHNELKHSIINGDAMERFRSLIKNRPDILDRVPLQTIASYLGITPAYLSRLKRSL